MRIRADMRLFPVRALDPVVLYSDTQGGLEQAAALARDDLKAITRMSMHRHRMSTLV